MIHYSNKFYVHGCVYEIVGHSLPKNESKVKRPDGSYFIRESSELAKYVHKKGHYLGSDKHGTKLTRPDWEENPHKYSKEVKDVSTKEVKKNSKPKTRQGKLL